MRTKARRYEYLFLCDRCFKVCRALVTRQAPQTLKCPECPDRPAMRLVYVGTARR
jgi:hypothetical protein